MIKKFNIGQSPNQRIFFLTVWESLRYFFFLKLKMGLHVPFIREHPLSGYSAIKLWLVACHSDGWASELFSYLHAGCLEFSQIWVLGLLSLSFGKSSVFWKVWEPSEQQNFFVALTWSACLWALFLWTHGLVFTLICFTQVCFCKLHPRCRSI